MGKLGMSFAGIFWALIVCGQAYMAASAIDDNKQCTRYFYTQTVRHPKKHCNEKVVLMSRCAGRCDVMSSADPVVGFRSVLRRPFKYRCSSCQDQTSALKAVRLRCRNNEMAYAVYRYILQCGCSACKSGLHLRSLATN